MPSESIVKDDYIRWLGEVKHRIQSARLSAARSVNREVIRLYWDIGRGIIEKQQTFGWGKSVVETLSRDLQSEFPGIRGFSADNLWRMRQFYSEYSHERFLAQADAAWKHLKVAAFLEQAVPEIRTQGQNKALEQTVPENRIQAAVLNLAALVPWGHHVEILKKVGEVMPRIYYLQATARFGWTRKVLLNQIKAGAYERSLAQNKTHNFPATLPEHLAEQADEALKSSYNLEFLGVSREIKERELEDRLIEQLKDFVLELGYGFCFIGRQYRLVLRRKEYFIDLLFYHRFLKCLVALELKIGEFEPEYAGKMDFYLNLLNDKVPALKAGGSDSSFDATEDYVKTVVGKMSVKKDGIVGEKGVLDVSCVGKESVKSSGSVGKTATHILSAIRANRMITIPELANLVGITSRSVERNLRKLQTEKPGHAVIRNIFWRFPKDSQVAIRTLFISGINRGARSFGSGYWLLAIG